MSIFSDIKDKITGNTTVQHSEYMGGEDRATGKTTNGTRVSIDRIGDDQTIVEIGNGKRLIMNGPGGGMAYEAGRGNRDHHEMDWDAANRVKVAVQNAMRDGQITPKEFDNIRMAADQAVDTQAAPPAHAHGHAANKGLQGGRG